MKIDRSPNTLIILLSVLGAAALCFQMALSLINAGMFNVSSPAVFAPIDLTSTGWLARRGFSSQDVNGFDPHAPGSIYLNRFPAILNSLFAVTSDGKVNDFTMMTSFNLPPAMISTPLSLSLAEVGDNWAVYLNGEEIQREIYLDTGGQIVLHRSILKALIPLPAGVVRPGSNLLVFHFIGNAPLNPIFYDFEPGFNYSQGYLIGSTTMLVHLRSFQEAVIWIQIGIYLVFCICSLFLFFRQKEAYSLLFGLYLLAFCVYSFFNSSLVYDTFPDTGFILRVLSIAYITTPALLGLCLHYYFYPSVRVPFVLRILAIVSALTMLAILVAPYLWVQTLSIGFVPVLMVGALYLFYMIIIAVRDGVPGARVLFFAGIGIIVLAVWAIMDFFVLKTGMTAALWIPFLLAIAFAFILIDRFWKITLELSGTNRQLASNRVTMEQEVSIRTSELLEANARLKKQLIEINELHTMVREQAIRDQLTGLFNRRILVETLEREFARALRQGQPISMVMMDIDHFKLLNDSLGHKAGDFVLERLGLLLRSLTRIGDIACRYGGEEFLVILPNAYLEDAVQRAEEWRHSIASMELEYDGRIISITVSVGVAEFPRCGHTPDEVLVHADDALYTAKDYGRNCVAKAEEIR